VARHWQTKEFHFSSHFQSNFQVRGCVLVAQWDIMHDSDVGLPLHCLGND